MSLALSQKLPDSGVRTLSCRIVSVVNGGIGMADFQYHPDSDDPVTKLRMAMDDMNGMYFCERLRQVNCPAVDELCSYSIPPEPVDISPTPQTSLDETAMNLDPTLLAISQNGNELVQTSDAKGLRAFPPPLFSRQAIPQGYKFVFLRKYGSDCLVLTSLFKFQGQYGIDGDNNY